MRLLPAFLLGIKTENYWSMRQVITPIEAKRSLIKPLGRFGKQEEVYGTVHYLISDASAFVTGAVVAVDGGFSSFSGV